MGAILVVGLALALLLVPLPADAIDTWYSNGVYLRLQRVVTPLSNLVPIAVFDLALAALLLLGLRMVAGRVRRHGVVRGALRAGGVIVVTAAAVYLVFLVMWGFNYRRVALEVKLDYDPQRVTRAAARGLATDDVRRVNEGRAAAMSAPASDADLARAFADVVVNLGAPGSPVFWLL
jgi:hypothetical protein